MHFAVSVVDNGDTHIISLLLQHKADINIKNNFGSTTLHVSAYFKGETPLDIACCRKDTNTVKELLEAGASKSPSLINHVLREMPINTIEAFDTDLFALVQDDKSINEVDVNGTKKV
jgi:ankyrin repeat protein